MRDKGVMDWTRTDRSQEGGRAAPRSVTFATSVSTSSRSSVSDRVSSGALPGSDITTVNHGAPPLAQPLRQGICPAYLRHPLALMRPALDAVGLGQHPATEHPTCRHQAASRPGYCEVRNAC